MVAGALLAGCGGDDDGSADCGTKTYANTADDVFADCFDKHFKSCESGRITIDNEGTQLKGTVVVYEIMGDAGAGACRVRWRYEKLPANPTWVGKDIFCPYPQGSSFTKALRTAGDFTGCTGPLVKLING